MKLRRIFSKNRKEATGWGRVRRGGSWNDGASDLRAANRDYNSPSDQGYDIGARLFRRIKRQR